MKHTVLLISEKQQLEDILVSSQHYQLVRIPPDRVDNYDFNLEMKYFRPDVVIINTQASIENTLLLLLQIRRVFDLPVLLITPIETSKILSQHLRDGLCLTEPVDATTLMHRIDETIKNPFRKTRIENTLFNSSEWIKIV